MSPPSASATTPTVSFSTSGSPGDVLPPTPSLTAPALDATVPAGPVTIQGSAGDNVGVANVQLAIMDSQTNRWFNPATNTFDNGPKIWFGSTLGSPNAVETTWNYVFNHSAAGSGSYYVTVRSSDAVGNTSTFVPFTRFTTGAADSVAPDTVISTPTAGQVLAPGTVAVTGTATDNVAVASVQVSLQDTGSGQWWDGTSWVGSQQWLAATVFSPGATSTGWSYSVPGVGAGSFSLQARARDVATNVDGSPASRAFSVAVPDTTIPTVSVSTPAGGASAPLGPVLISGSAADNAGVTQVRVSIRNSALQWWNGTSWGAWAYVPATLTNPNATSTDWSLSFTPPATGGYGFQVKSVDAAGNVSANSMWRNFSAT